MHGPMTCQIMPCVGRKGIRITNQHTILESICISYYSSASRQRHQRLPLSPISCTSGSQGRVHNVPSKLEEAAGTVTSLFPLWVCLAGAVALLKPALFDFFSLSYVTPALGLTMLGMGLTLRLEDFMQVVKKMPALLFLGLALQFSVMPLLGYSLSRFAGLAPGLACGICVLSACPGGTASNIVAFIARGEMPLSILMTTASTLAAIVMTPLLVSLLAGAYVPVDPMSLLVSCLQVVLLPVALGALLNQAQPQASARVAKFTPALATLLIALIVGKTLGHNSQAALSAGLPLLTAVAALHVSGFIIGYAVSKMLGLSNKLARTNSIEVGMQNATLGACLAVSHFADPLVSVPCAVSSCAQSVIASLIAAYWRATTNENE
jgi:BASS family bile acid:Na+ symporter